MHLIIPFYYVPLSCNGNSQASEILEGESWPLLGMNVAPPGGHLWVYTQVLNVYYHSHKFDTSSRFLTSRMGCIEHILSSVAPQSP